MMIVKPRHWMPFFILSVLRDHQPFNIIQCKGFKYLMKKLAPLYKIPNKKCDQEKTG